MNADRKSRAVRRVLVHRAGIVQAPGFTPCEYNVAAFVDTIRESPEPLLRVRGPEDVGAILDPMRAMRREAFVVLLLNARNEWTHTVTVGIGSLNASIVHPREVFAPAIVHGAASIVCAHNHPSGDPEPSEEDIGISKRLVQVGELVGIGVLDSVILAARGTVSLRSRQLL